MPPLKIPQLSALVIVFIAILAPVKPDPSSTVVYDVLKSHELPIGIFPKSISGFSIDDSSGRFQFQLPNSPCDAKFENQVRYDGNVTGIISTGQISNLSGIATEELFLWLPVSSIQVDIPSSGLIYFEAGVVSKQFSLSLFEEPRDCTTPAAAEDSENEVNDRFSKPLDLSFLNYRARTLENPSEKSFKEGIRAPELRAAV